MLTLQIKNLTNTETYHETNNFPNSGHNFCTLRTLAPLGSPTIPCLLSLVTQPKGLQLYLWHWTGSNGFSVSCQTNRFYRLENTRNSYLCERLRHPS